MNVFVLGTGRCGTSTFHAACTHIDNYTLGHETRNRNWRDRLTYPDNHIEIDHRLSFFLGTLGKQYPDAFYVHLLRNPEAVAKSWSQRTGTDFGLMTNWPKAAFFRPKDITPLDAARLMVESVNDNIESFLHDKPSTTIWIEDPHEGFDEFWNTIRATGDRHSAQQALSYKYNARVLRRDPLARERIK